MRSIGFFWRVFGGTVAVISITAIGVYMAALPTIERSLEVGAELRVEREAAWAVRLCAQAFDASSGVFDASRLRADPALDPGSRFTLVLPDGCVLFDAPIRSRRRFERTLPGPRA